MPTFFSSSSFFHLHSIACNQALGFLGLEPAAYAQFYRGALDIDGESGADQFSFNLRTRARDAVLFFCGRGSQYYLLELSRGRLMFQFMLDSRCATRPPS